MMLCTNWKVLDYSDYVVSIEIEMRNALFKQKQNAREDLLRFLEESAAK